MKRRTVLRGVAAVVLLALGGFGGWILFLPAAPVAAGAPAIDSREAEAIVAALKPPKRPRPVIAVVGINDATETTDYLMPTGILRRADVADVMTVATNPGAMVLDPPSRLNRTRPSPSSTRGIRMARTTSSCRR